MSGRGGSWEDVILCRSSELRTTMIGCGIFFVDDLDDCNQLLLLFRRLSLNLGLGIGLGLGLGLPLPSVNCKLAFSSLSQNRDMLSSSEWCRLLGISCRMLKLDRDNILNYGPDGS